MKAGDENSMKFENVYFITGTAYVGRGLHESTPGSGMSASCIPASRSSFGMRAGVWRRRWRWWRERLD